MNDEASKSPESPWLITLPSGRRRPVEMRDIAGAIACSASLNDAASKLMCIGLSQEHADFVLRVFQEHNTLESEGIWAGVTARQRAIAMVDAADAVYLGKSPEQTIKTLAANGYSLEQANAAVADYLDKHRTAQTAGAPMLMLTGAGVAAIGILASIVSAKVMTSYHNIYIGAIVSGVAMICVGAYRSMR